MRKGPKIRVCAFIQRDGRVLLVRQRRAHSTYWLLPGGGVELGETLQGALNRELEEECGVTVRASGPPLALVQTISPDGGASRHLIQIVFPAEIVSGDSPSGPQTPHPPAIDRAIQEIRWFERSSLRGLALHPPVHDLLATWLDRAPEIGSMPASSCVVTDPLWVAD